MSRYRLDRDPDAHRWPPKLAMLIGIVGSLWMFATQWQGSLGGGPFEVVVGVILAAIITVFGVMFILDVSVETVE